MPVSIAFIKELENVDPQLRRVLLAMLEELERQREECVSKKDFDELKEIVRELGKTVAELAEAQKRTEERLASFEKQTEENFQQVWKALNELAEAQKRTEEEVAKLARGLQRVRREVGGLSRSVAYALENEAYRHLPAFLEARYNLRIIDRLIRTYLNGEEINIFGKAEQEGQGVYLVGEAVLKLDDPAKLKQVLKKARLVKDEFGQEVIPIIVTHFAKPQILEKAREDGIIVVQSFEWI